MCDVEINEQTTGYLDVTCKDENGNAITPSSVQYRIDEALTGQEIRDWTSATPGSPTVITLSAADNECLLDLAEETHRVTVKAGYGVGKQITAEYSLTVKNLKFIE